MARYFKLINKKASRSMFFMEETLNLNSGLLISKCLALQVEMLDSYLQTKTATVIF